ncbi:uncharacterized protein ACA1_090530 [Acanthamoeba castellanii str. Neff]|uniref:Uncharacterized protein n=1 Tax=Acanthamoeba castellanii (strain ATCC 30010 / Neff) TaxID=1257118 RepID=L8HBR8_ACACF|nr:uncharacterized protein ACA1_090530 [Acanthamoeba castellanii str. Neff]ELR22630.1 hypothetical protein ACA1_090530 [Acanthamoeba castellanii str. Neff]
MDQRLCDNSAPEGYTTIMLEEWMKKDPKKNKLLLVQVAMLFIIGKLKKFSAKCWKDCLLRQGMFNSACNYVLKSKNDCSFVMFNKDCTILSFDNGIFCTMQQVDKEDPSIEYMLVCHFMQYGSPELAWLPAQFGLANYIWGSINPEWLMCNLHDILMPVVEGML